MKKVKKVVERPKPITKKIKLKKKKKIISINQPVVDIPVASPPVLTSEKVRPTTITFYGHSIRTTFMNNQWFFSLEDILKIVNVVEPTKFLIDLKNHDGLKEKYYQLVETFSYYEGDSPIIIPVANYQNFLELLPTLREMNLIFPGPFPDWLKEVANRKF